MDSFGDHFKSLLSHGVKWTSISNSNHKSKLCKNNFRRLIACNVKLRYKSKWGYEGIK